MNDLYVWDVTWKNSVPGKYKSMTIVASCALHAMFFHPSGKYIYSVVNRCWLDEENSPVKIDDWVDSPSSNSLLIVSRGGPVDPPLHPVISSTWNK